MKSSCSLFLFILSLDCAFLATPQNSSVLKDFLLLWKFSKSFIYKTIEMYHLFWFNFYIKIWCLGWFFFLTCEWVFVPTLSAFKTILPLTCFDKNHMAVIARVHFCFFLIFCSLDLSFPLVLYYLDCCNYMVTCQISLILFFFKIYFDYCFLFIFKTHIHTHIPHWDFVKNHIALWSVLEKI